jgi:hypothetical protein
MSPYLIALATPKIPSTLSDVMPQLQLWYQRARAKLPDAFNVVVLDLLDWETHEYVNGGAILSSPPCHEKFTGKVVGRRIGGKFQAWAAINGQGDVEGGTLAIMQRRLQELGFTPLTVTPVAASDLTTISQLVTACEDAALVLPADPQMVDRMLNHRAGPSVCLQVGHKKMTTGTAVIDAPTPATALPVAVLSGELRHPISTYINDLATLGYQVRTTDDPNGPLPDDVALVIYSSRSKKTPWAEAALAAKKLAWSATDLSEKVRAARHRRGG